MKCHPSWVAVWFTECDVFDAEQVARVPQPVLAHPCVPMTFRVPNHVLPRHDAAVVAVTAIASPDRR